MHVEWVTLLSDKIKDSTDKNFSGIVVIENWNGEFKRAFSHNGDGSSQPVIFK